MLSGDISYLERKSKASVLISQACEYNTWSSQEQRRCILSSIISLFKFRLSYKKANYHINKVHFSYNSSFS